MDCFTFKHYRIDGMSNDESMFLSNLFSWSKSKKFKEPVYKTDKEMATEINCAIRSVRYMKDKFVKQGILKKGKQKSLMFNGATSYFLEIEKILTLNNLEMLREIKKITGEAVTKTTNGGDKNDHRRLPELSPPMTKTTTSYIEQFSLREHSENTQIAPPSLSASDALPQLTDYEFKLFEASYPAPIRNWKKTQQAFFEFLPTSLSIHGSNFERFLKAVKLFKEDEAIRRKRIEGAGGVFEESSIMEPHNFIWGLKWNDPSYLNRIDKQENKHNPVSELDKRFQVLVQPFIEKCPQVKDLHLPSFKDGKPMWSGSTIALSQLHVELMKIVEQLKEETGWKKTSE